jgi:nucleoside-triphosphatase
MIRIFHYGYACYCGMTLINREVSLIFFEFIRKMVRNIFLTGPPSSGKTTVIRKVMEQIGGNATGFYTQEIKKRDRRVGFMMKTLDGKEGLLGHEDVRSTYHIRRYGVSIENIESIAVPALTPQSEDMIIVIDEIGKMECFSAKFCEAALNAINAPNRVVGTIAVGGTDFIRSVKERNDITICEVTLHNRDRLPDQLIKMLL